MSQPTLGIDVQLKMLAGSVAQSFPPPASSVRFPSISSGVPGGDGSTCRKPLGISAATTTVKLAPGARDPMSQKMRSRLTALTRTCVMVHSVLLSDQER